MYNILVNHSQNKAGPQRSGLDQPLCSSGACLHTAFTASQSAIVHCIVLQPAAHGCHQVQQCQGGGGGGGERGRKSH